MPRVNIRHRNAVQAEGRKIDFDHWHAEVHHELPYSELLHPDCRSREALFSMRVPRYIFTNADQIHAELCLQRLGLEGCFQVCATELGVDTLFWPHIVSSCRQYTVFPYLVLLLVLSVDIAVSRWVSLFLRFHRRHSASNV
jgi:hypothetical protein